MRANKKGCTSVRPFLFYPVKMHCPIAKQGRQHQKGAKRQQQHVPREKRHAVGGAAEGGEARLGTAEYGTPDIKVNVLEIR